LTFVNENDKLIIVNWIVGFYTNGGSDESFPPKNIYSTFFEEKLYEEIVFGVWDLLSILVAGFFIAYGYSDNEVFGP